MSAEYECGLTGEGVLWPSPEAPGNQAKRPTVPYDHEVLRFRVRTEWPKEIDGRKEKR